MTYQSPWWLKTAHLQTVYPALFRKPASLPHIRRERLATPDDDFIDIDFCGEGEGPLVILLHGLTGSSRSGYIMGLQCVFRQRGWRSAALNFRGCSGEPNRLARCYHSGETEDIDFLYRTLRQREPHTALAAAGFSLGGNVLLKWLGEQGSGVKLSAAVAVSAPLVLSICATKLDVGFSKIYRDRLLFELKDYLNAKLDYLIGIGQDEEAAKIQRLGDLSSVKSFWQYDDRVVAKLHGFEDVHDYYRRSSSRQYLNAIRVPTLLIQAFDDPFMTPAVLPEPGELSSSVRLEVTKGGGHVGFVEGRNPLKPGYWLERRIPLFLAEQGFPIDGRLD